MPKFLSICLKSKPNNSFHLENTDQSIYRSIKKYLRHKICILVTHQIQFLQDATKIIVLDNVCMKMMVHYDES